MYPVCSVCQDPRRTSREAGTDINHLSGFMLYLGSVFLRSSAASVSTLLLDSSIYAAVTALNYPLPVQSYVRRRSTFSPIFKLSLKITASRVLGGPN